MVEGAFGEPPSREVFVDRGIEVESAFFDQCHDAPRGDPLAQRRNLEHRVPIHGIADRGGVLVVDGATFDQRQDGVAGMSGIEELDRGVREGTSVTARRERLAPPSLRRAHDHDRGPRNEHEDGRHADLEQHPHRATRFRSDMP
jgi:hypothetical protein